MGVLPVFENKKRFGILKIVSVIITMAGVMTSFVFINVTDWVVVIGNGTQVDYVESFDLLMNEMQEHYVMNEWKEIDYDEIREELMPKVMEANENQDREAYYLALQEYVNYFHDGHIWLEANTAAGVEARNHVVTKLEGNDYGFSLFTIDSGETIAILVEDGSEAMENGILDGTVITKWNGVPVDKAISNAEYLLIDREPVLTNMELMKPLYFAGMGGETITISFLDKKGTERTASIKSTGSYDERLNYAVECLFHRYHFPSDQEIINMTDEERKEMMMDAYQHNENFKSEMITSDCGYLAITSEQLDVYKDTLAEIKGSYPEVTELVDQKLESMKAQGMKKLIIDTRGNAGGYPMILQAVTSLFTKKEIDMGYEAYRPYVGGTIRRSVTRTVPANGKWADLPIIVLTNAECCSSGDGLVYALSQCSNVKTVGISNSQGIYQSVGGVCYTTNSDFSVRYPVFYAFDSNGEPMIDPKGDRECRVPIDEIIPITQEGALEIFTYEKKEDLDYEIKYALDLFPMDISKTGAGLNQ
ncbi:MAG: S41 family peptidase [Clostridiales bacterium]|nr:S41 family peptidase [Clostridiales bacterium]